MNYSLISILLIAAGTPSTVRSFSTHQSSSYSRSTVVHNRSTFLPTSPHSLISLRALPLVDVTSSFDSLLSSIWTADAIVSEAVDALTTVADPISAVTDASDAVTAVADAASPATYSKFSYYTTLGVYVLSFPGLWSQIKRSTKAKLKSKTYESPGEASDSADAKSLRQQAGEIMAYMKANNYEVAEAGEVITFRGLVAKSKSQAFFLTFCTVLGLASLALVLQISFIDLELPVIGKPNWFYLCLLSPYAGIYYWRSGDREDEFKVKLSSNEDETTNEIILQGDDEEINRMWRALNLVEKGMVKIEGLLESS